MQISAETISSNENREYSVVRLSKKNLADVAKLHKAVYGTTAATDHFPKKYDTAYTGVEDVGYIAYNEQGLPVAYYGVIPCFIQYGKEIMLAAQSADTMTDPNFRFKGMFVELSNMTFALCRQLGIRLIFGFPNQNSYHGAVNKLGWKMTGAMSCFTIPVNGLPLESLAYRLNIFRKPYKQYTRFILRKEILPLQGVANSVVAGDFAGLYRNNEYLCYKTYSPTSVIGIGDAKIWISHKYGLMIGDMEGVNEKNFDRVMNKLKSIAKKLGIKQMQFHVSPDTSLYPLFSGNYTETASYPMLFQDFGSAIPPEKVKFTFADIDIF